MLKLIILPPAAHFLKKLKEKPLKNLFQKTVDKFLLILTLAKLRTGIFQVFTLRYILR